MKNRRNYHWLTLPITILLCLSLGENFPFSPFPMYSSFSDYSYYVYFSDGDGKPVPIKSLTGHRTSKIKKIYNKALEEQRKELKKAGEKIEGLRFMTVDQRRPAGDELIRWLDANVKGNRSEAYEAAKPLQFHHVGLFIENNRTKPVDEVVARTDD